MISLATAVLLGRRACGCRRHISSALETVMELHSDSTLSSFTLSYRSVALVC